MHCQPQEAAPAHKRELLALGGAIGGGDVEEKVREGIRGRLPLRMLHCAPREVCPQPGVCLP